MTSVTKIRSGEVGLATSMTFLTTNFEQFVDSSDWTPDQKRAIKSVFAFLVSSGELFYFAYQLKTHPAKGGGRLAELLYKKVSGQVKAVNQAALLDCGIALVDYILHALSLGLYSAVGPLGVMAWGAILMVEYNSTVTACVHDLNRPSSSETEAKTSQLRSRIPPLEVIPIALPPKRPFSTAPQSHRTPGPRPVMVGRF